MSIRPPRLASILAVVVATTANGQPTQHQLFYVDDARPVAQAIMEMTDSLTVVITYEDPRYEYPADVRDVTEQVRNPLNRNAANSDRRVLVPRGGFMQFSYEVFVDTGQPADIADALAGILEANESGDFGGRFEVLEAGGVFHVVPTRVRNAEGRWVRQNSILDTRITIEPQDVNGHEALDLIVNAVSEATGIPVGHTGGRFANSLMRYAGRIEATNEPARDVLLRTLHAMSERFT